MMPCVLGAFPCRACIGTGAGRMHSFSCARVCIQAHPSQTHPSWCPRVRVWSKSPVEPYGHSLHRIRRLNRRPHLEQVRNGTGLSRRAALKRLPACAAATQHVEAGPLAGLLVAPQLGARLATRLATELAPRRVARRVATRVAQRVAQLGLLGWTVHGLYIDLSSAWLCSHSERAIVPRRARWAACGEALARLGRANQGNVLISC